MHPSRKPKADARTRWFRPSLLRPLQLYTGSGAAEDEALLPIVTPFLQKRLRVVNYDILWRHCVSIYMAALP